LRRQRLKTLCSSLVDSPAVGPFCGRRASKSSGPPSGVMQPHSTAASTAGADQTMQKLAEMNLRIQQSRTRCSGRRDVSPYQDYLVSRVWIVFARGRGHQMRARRSCDHRPAIARRHSQRSWPHGSARRSRLTPFVPRRTDQRQTHQGPLNEHRSRWRVAIATTRQICCRCDPRRRTGHRPHPPRLAQRS
jgi:hypothetical protein